MKLNAINNISAIFLAAAMVSMAASCSKEENSSINEDSISSKQITLSASMELPDADTKTSLDGLNVNWSTGDKISVFFGDNSTNCEFALEGTGGGSTGRFTGTQSVESTLAMQYIHTMPLLPSAAIPLLSPFPPNGTINPAASMKE